MTVSNSRGDSDPTDTIRTVFDWVDVDPSMAVIEMVSDILGQNPTDLEPLYFSVDPDALDRLIQGDGVNSDTQKLSVSFSFIGYVITVLSNGVVELERDE